MVIGVGPVGPTHWRTFCIYLSISLSLSIYIYTKKRYIYIYIQGHVCFPPRGPSPPSPANNMLPLSGESTCLTLLV